MDARSWLFLLRSGHQCKAEGKKDAVHRLNVSWSEDSNRFTSLVQDIVETSRETYKGLTCDRPSQRVKLGELEPPRLKTDALK
jgi:hypothetical protein